MRSGLLFLLLASAAASSAHAGEAWLGLFDHDTPVGIADCCFEKGADIQVGVRSGPLAPLRGLGDFRVYALGSANTVGGVSFGAAGLAWRWSLGNSPFYLQPGIGGAIQSGSDARYQVTPNKLYLGSRVLFEPEFSVGWRVSPRWTLEGSYVHLSHAQLAGPQNPGLDDAGVRVVYCFGP